MKKAPMTNEEIRRFNNEAFRYASVALLFSAFSLYSGIKGKDLADIVVGVLFGIVGIGFLIVIKKRAC